MPKGHGFYIKTVQSWPKYNSMYMSMPILSMALLSSLLTGDHIRLDYWGPTRAPNRDCWALGWLIGHIKKKALRSIKLGTLRKTNVEPQTGPLIDYHPLERASLQVPCWLSRA